MIKNFCNKINLCFRFAVSIGGGGFIDATKNLPLFKKDSSNINNALELIKIDIHGKSDKENLDNIMIKPFLPKALVLLISSKSWYFLSKKNGLSKEELYKKPYLKN